MNFAIAPPKKLMNNVGRTTAIVCTMLVTERTWEYQKPTYSREIFSSDWKYQVDSEQALSPKEGGDDEECVEGKGK